MSIKCYIPAKKPDLWDYCIEQVRAVLADPNDGAEAEIHLVAPTELPFVVGSVVWYLFSQIRSEVRTEIDVDSPVYWCAIHGVASQGMCTGRHGDKIEVAPLDAGGSRLLIDPEEVVMVVPFAEGLDAAKKAFAYLLN